MSDQTNDAILRGGPGPYDFEIEIPLSFCGPEIHVLLGTSNICDELEDGSDHFG